MALRRPGASVQASLGLWLSIAATPLGSWLEASMASHMLVQIPLLAAAGWGASRAVPRAASEKVVAWCGGCVPLLLVAVFASSYWMLPRALDAALADPLAEAAKLFSVPLLVGVPLGLAWPRLGALGRGFWLTNTFSMLAVVGWLYLAAPSRVCNAYPVQDQAVAGAWMVTIAVLLFLGWIARWFVGVPVAQARRAARPAS